MLLAVSWIYFLTNPLNPCPPLKMDEPQEGHPQQKAAREEHRSPERGKATSFSFSSATGVEKLGWVKVINQGFPWSNPLRKAGRWRSFGGEAASLSPDLRDEGRVTGRQGTQAAPWPPSVAHLAAEPVVLISADGELPLPLLHAGRGLLQRRGQPGVTLPQCLQLNLPLLHVGCAEGRRQTGQRWGHQPLHWCTSMDGERTPQPTPRGAHPVILQ